MVQSERLLINASISLVASSTAYFETPAGSIDSVGVVCGIHDGGVAVATDIVDASLAVGGSLALLVVVVVIGGA